MVEKNQIKRAFLLSSQGSNTLPIGTILPYIGDLSKIPHGWALCDGNNGTPNLTGRFLQGWGWDDFYNRNIGDYIQEGLPNIYGQFGNCEESNGTQSGAFRAWRTNRGGDANDGGYNFDFNATRCSWIYGNSPTVQPRAFVVCYIIRIM